MKKIFMILLSALLCASGFMFTSCEDEEVTEVLAGPTNTWCKMPVSYSTTTTDAEGNATDATANLYAYFYYTNNDVTIGNKTLPAGLNLVVTAKDSATSSIISALASNMYILKTFPKDGETTIDNEGDAEGDTDIIKINNARAKWAAIYWGKDELRKSENKSSTAPSAFTNGTEVTNLTDIKNFSIKKLLANYLLSILDA